MHRPLAFLPLLTLLASLVAQESEPLRLEVRAEGGNLEIGYSAAIASRFVLLGGPTPTAIQTALATNNGASDPNRFVVPLLGTGSQYFRVLRETTIANLPLTTVDTSPGPGEAGVAVTRETILRFSLPLAADTQLDTTRFFATSAGRKLISRVELSSDRRTATLFYLENLPASSRVQVTLDAQELRDFAGRFVDADGDGEAGDVLHFDFDTLTITPVKGTAVIGRIFRSELGPGSLAPTNVIETPLQGVTIEVVGAEETIRTVSDANGNFRLRDCPAGRFFARIDGRTAVGSQWPDGDYYPVVEKAWEAMAGHENNPAGGRGTIYLPLIRRGTLQPASATETTVIAFPSSVLAEHPELAGVEVTVPPNVLVSPDGSRGGRIGITPVSPERLPEPLPPGLDHVLDISIQTDGAQNFDQPLPVRFPNLPDPKTGQRLPPGAKSALWSYDHDVGAWVVSGPMTVTADGMFLESDPGYGVLKPGWHGSGPSPASPPNCRSLCCPPGGAGSSASASTRVHLHTSENECRPCCDNDPAYESCLERCRLPEWKRTIVCAWEQEQCLNNSGAGLGLGCTRPPPGCGPGPDPCNECKKCDELGRSVLQRSQVQLMDIRPELAQVLTMLDQAYAVGRAA